MPPCGRVCRAGSLEDGCLVGILLCAQRVCRFCEFCIAQGIGMAFLDAGHLVIRNGIQLIVGDGSDLCLEFVERDGDILVLECLKRNRIGRVVDEDIGINTYFDEVDDIVVDDGRLVRNPVEP